MKGLYKYIIIATTAWKLSFSVFGQPSLNADKKLQEYLRFETNQAIYVPGEEMLVSLKCWHANNQLSKLSQVAYLEIIDENKHSVLSQATELKSGLGYAAIYLPTFLKTGNYTLIAYTRWMRNYPLMYIQQHPITILNPYEALPIDFFNDEKKVKLLLDLKGGYLYENRFNELNIQALDEYNQPVTVTARLVTDESGVIQEVTSDQYGRGKFTFDFDPSESYKIITVQDDKKIQFHSMAHLKSKKVFVVVEEKKEAFEIIKDDTLVDVQLEIVKEGIPIRNYLLTSNRTVIPKTEMPSGRFEILVSHRGNSIYQQSFSIEPQFIHIPMEIKMSSIKTREMVEVVVNWSEELIGDTLVFSVRKKVDALPLPKADYAVSIDTTRNRSIEFLPDFRGALLSGILRDKAQVPIANTLVFLSDTSPDMKLHLSTTNGLGKFYFILPASHIKNDLFITVQGVEQYVDIEIEKPFIGDYGFVRSKKLKKSPVPQYWLEQRSIELQIENAYYFSKQIESVKDIGRFDQWPKVSYDMDKFTRFPNLEDPIKEYIEEVWLKRQDGKDRFVFPYLKGNVGVIDTALTMINGIPVIAMDVFNQNPDHFERIDIYPDQYNIDGNEFQGIINFATYRGKANKIDIGLKGKKIDYPMVMKYAKNLPVRQQIQSKERIPDYRNQLLFVPHMIPKQESETIKFRTSESTGTYEIVIHGRLSNGTFIEERKEFMVIE